jgi:cytochrome c-type biogenesis protein CcmH/NrfF
VNPQPWYIWLVPVVALTLVAAIGVMIYSRPKREDEPTDSVQEYERFRSAMRSQIPTAKPRPTSAPPSDAPLD